MIDVTVRLAEPADLAAIVALNDAAFGQRDESKIVQRLLKDGDSVVSLVAEVESHIVGHIQFFRILVDGEAPVIGLGPMSVAPSVQKQGIGALLIKSGLDWLRAAGEKRCFVLGHVDYYPRFGFQADLAENFDAPWSGPFFMALVLNEGGPESGRLTYPAAFGTG